MPANIQDVHGELESINASINRLSEVTQEHSQRISSSIMSAGGGAGGGGIRSDLGTIVKGLIEANGLWGRMLNMAGILVKGQALSYQLVFAVDKLQYSNISSGRNIEKSIAKMTQETGTQLGGVQENLRMLMQMQEAGIDVAFGAGNEQEALLRRQLTLLDKDMGQGTLMLNYVKSLVTRGFTRSEAHESLRHLADISFTSIQNGVTQANMLKKMNENMALLKTADPELAASMIAIEHSKLYKDATDVQKNMIAEMMNFITSPEGTEQFSMWAQLGGQELQDRLKFLGQDLMAAGTNTQKREAVEQKIMMVMQDAALAIKGLGGDMFGGRSTLGRQAMLRGSPYFEEVRQFIEIANGVMGGFIVQQDIDKKRSEDVNGEFFKTWDGLSKGVQDNTMLLLDKLTTAFFKAVVPDGTALRTAMMPVMESIGEWLIKGAGYGADATGALARLIESGAKTLEQVKEWFNDPTVTIGGVDMTETQLRSTIEGLQMYQRDTGIDRSVEIEMYRSQLAILRAAAETKDPEPGK